MCCARQWWRPSEKQRYEIDSPRAAFGVTPQGATPAIRRSRPRGVSGFGHFTRCLTFYEL
ncbi:MAG: hypothetical protein C0453_10955 [Comamonadaceae bacterium]|nr:hypothetical protein [Comamonadaceae bacterium]